LRRWSPNQEEDLLVGELGERLKEIRSNLPQDAQRELRRAELQSINWKPLWALPAGFAAVVMLLFMVFFREPPRRKDSEAEPAPAPEPGPAPATEPRPSH
ncbi:MAG TPA: hypothetical protein VMS21_11255, partial [Methylomirabilota bacterium]|nr:hypothetical protein [Methylomirabilota bacterium]